MAAHRPERIEALAESALELVGRTSRSVRRFTIIARSRNDMPDLHGCRLRAVIGRSRDVSCDRMAQLVQGLPVLLKDAADAGARER